MAVVTVPKVLREKLSEEGADALVELINKADEKGKEDILKFLEEKFEVKLEAWGEKLETKISASEKTIEEKFERRLAEEIGKVRVELGKEIVETRASLKNEIAETRAALEVKIEASKAELIRWMFIFIMGQFWAIVGVLFAFFRK